MAKYTSKNVEQLAEVLKDHKAKGQKITFFVGAGCSISAGIPDSKTLVKEMNDKFSVYLAELGEEEKSNYRACMSQLTVPDQKELLGTYIDEAKVNWAHLAMASLIKKNYIHRVLTTNFDQVLAHACGLLGQYPATYDFGNNPSQSVDHIVSPAIIHLHGQRHGVKLLNAETDTDGHLPQIQNLLNDSCGEGHLVVIGYSGAADPLLEALRQQIERSTCRLTWCEYGQNLSPDIKELLAVKPGLTNGLLEVDADVFLPELAQALGCWPPLLFDNPASHLLEELAPVINYPKDLGGTDLVDQVRAVLKGKQADLHTDPFVQRLMKGSWDDIIEREGEAKTPQQKSAVGVAYFMKGVALSEKADLENDSDKKRALYDQAIETYAKALSFAPDDTGVLNNWGLALTVKADLEGDVDKKQKLYDQAIAKYIEAASRAPDDTDVLTNWGVALRRKAELEGNVDEQQKLYDQAIAKYVEASNIAPDNVNVLNNWGLALTEKAGLEKDNDEKQRLYEEAIAKYAKASNIAPDNVIVLNNWGGALSRKADLEGDVDEKQKLYNQAIAKIGKASNIAPDNVKVLDNLAGLYINVFQGSKDFTYLDKAKKVALKEETVSGKPSYNLACVYALQDKEDQCRETLEACKKAGTLPDKDHVLSDEDLEACWDKPWLIALFDEGREEDEARLD